MRRLSFISHTTQGFTLVELMVTITVMLIVTSISIFNYTEFNSVTVTNALAYDMALAIRQAQQYGVSVRESGTNRESPISVAGTNIDDFKKQYGIHFSANNSNSRQFQLFVDNSIPIDLYNDGEALEVFTLQQGSKIVSVCTTKSNVESCMSGTGFVDILFRRPDPDAYVNTGTGVDNTTTVKITIQNTTGTLQKTVVVSPSGQISLQ